MVRKRLDDRVRTLLVRSIQTRQRAMLVLVGDYGKDQIPNLHRLLTQCRPDLSRPSVLWCYKKELGFSTHKKKRMKKLQRDKARGLMKSNPDDSAAATADNFELFMSQTDITWCYYKDSHRVLGTTVGLLVLQDFEAMTPNLLARTIETVQGGGLIVFLLRTVTSLQQLYTMTMDVHARYRTESSSGGELVPRFNERFILSLGQCPHCLVCDDELNILPLSRKALGYLSQKTNTPSSEGAAAPIISDQEEEELKQLKESLIDTPHVGVLVELTKTLDQAKALLVFLDACSEKDTTSRHQSTVAMTAPRGRGKSATVGLCLAGAVALGYSQVAVTSPEPENLVAVFDFVCRGLRALKYQEHSDYNITYNQASGRDQIKCITAIRIYRTHRQVIQYVPPDQADRFASAEIVAIDEAAAIPLPVVRSLLHQPDRLTFLSSTVHGYEGTGRALSLKLVKELRETKGGRHAVLEAADAAASSVTGPKSNKSEAKVHEQRWAAAAAAASDARSNNLPGHLREIELTTPIRYASGDAIENWLNQLLCLDCGSSDAHTKLTGRAPAPAECELYSVDRDALFSYHKLSESFLQRIMSLYTSAHYKNTPNDLQMLSDAPAHHVFVLLPPTAEQQSNKLPDVLAVVQVALEGRISRKAVEAQLARGHRSAGDLIPWTISQQFGDSKFAQMSGARIVRIAVHPSVQGMGYGSRAMELLHRFYNGEMISLANEDDGDVEEEDEEGKEVEDNDSEEGDNGIELGDGIHGEKLKPRRELPPLLLPLTEVDAPRLDWIGTSFGLTLQLHKFWSRIGMQLLYLRQTRNDLTGEHSAIMVRALPKRSGFDDAWLSSFVGDTRRRLVTLLGGPFRNMEIRLAVSILENVSNSATASNPSRSGSSHVVIATEELDQLLTPHDLKRLELYGRNLCDHHLVTDLIPIVARIYFTGRFGSDFSLSSVQGAILCGIGLQQREVESLVTELALPSNQVLAIFNKAVRKASIALNAIIEDREKKSMLSAEERAQVEKKASKMGDVARKTLDEDIAEAADEAMKALKQTEMLSLPPEVAQDAELMQYVVKGSDAQWEKALYGRNVTETGMIQIQGTREKRKALDLDQIMPQETKSNRKRKAKGKR